MWSLVKAEYRYHRWIFAGGIALTPLLALAEVYPVMEDLPVRFWLVLLIFLMLQNWVSFRNKERRERLIAQLPVTPFQAAMSRYVMLTVSAILLVSWFSLWLKGLDRMTPVYLSLHLKTLGIILTGFVAYYAIRDLFLFYFRNKGITKNSIVIGLMFFFVGLNILGIIVFMKANSGEIPNLAILDMFVYYVVRSDPFAGMTGIFTFSALCVLLGALNIATYHWRRAFLDKEI